MTGTVLHNIKVSEDLIGYSGFWEWDITVAGMWVDSSVPHRLLNGGSHFEEASLLNSGYETRVQVTSQPFWYYTIPKIDTLSITLDPQTQQQVLCVTEPMLLSQVVNGQ